MGREREREREEREREEREKERKRKRERQERDREKQRRREKDRKIVARHMFLYTINRGINTGPRRISLQIIVSSALTNCSLPAASRLKNVHRFRYIASF